MLIRGRDELQKRSHASRRPAAPSRVSLPSPVGLLREWLQLLILNCKCSAGSHLRSRVVAGQCRHRPHGFRRSSCRHFASVARPSRRVQRRPRSRTLLFRRPFACVFFLTRSCVLELTVAPVVRATAPSAYLR